jgi:hypothetical protein
MEKNNVGNESISVTGFAKQDFVSDLIVWDGYFTAESKNTKTAYSELKQDAEIIKKYLISKGIKEKEIIFSSVTINSDYEYMHDKEGNSIKEFKGYILSQKPLPPMPRAVWVD